MYDLPIAAGILISMGVIPEGLLKDWAMIGELGLNGEIRHINGVLPMLMCLRDSGVKGCIIPADNLREGINVQGIDIIAPSTFSELLDILKSGSLEDITYVKNNSDCMCSGTGSEELAQTVDDSEELDYADVMGQEVVKRAAMIGAAGGHHILISGPPGAGKSMIARRLSTIMPELTAEEKLEVSIVYSIAGMLNDKMAMIEKRPFLSPHHSISSASLCGGGRLIRPGVISMAHKGVLFLDELPEFSRECIEMLREPLEEKTISVNRLNDSCVLPADFLMVAAMNPCPCGYYPNRNMCNCAPSAVARYRDKISGPIKDRIDIIVTAKALDPKRVIRGDKGLTSLVMRQKVMLADRIQKERYRDEAIDKNGQLNGKLVGRYCVLGDKERAYMESVYEQMNLTARSYHKLLKVSRTIADLEGEDRISVDHIREAACYRGFFN
jgi:magnesium chelatase family protein